MATDGIQVQSLKCEWQWPCLVPRPLSVFHFGQSGSRGPSEKALRHRNELIVRAWRKGIAGQAVAYVQGFHSQTQRNH